MLGKENISNGTITLDLTREKLIFTDPVTIIDDDWIQSSFMVSLAQLDNLKELTLFTTSADRKMTNSAIGKSLAVNAPYAFTRYVDPPVPGRVLDNEYMNVANLGTKLGMGPYYAKAIDDNNTTSLLFLTPGVVQFSSLISVFVRAVDYKTSVIANEGRYPTMYDVGDFIGTASMALVFPLRSLLIYALKGVGKVVSLLSDHSYYRIKPTPAQYWSMVQNITNSLAAERGILALRMAPKTEKGNISKHIGSKYVYDNYRMDYLRYNFPTIFTKSMGVNVFAIATRAQKNVFNQMMKETSNVTETGKPNPAIDERVVDTTVSYDDTVSLDEFISATLKSEIYTEKEPDRSEPKTNEDVEKEKDAYKQNKDGIKPLPSEESTFLGNALSAFLASTEHGADGPVFHVDYIGSTSDTFSNTVKDIPLKNKINSLGGAARDIRFSLAGGNLVGDTVNAVTNGVKELIAGTASGLTFGLSDLIFGLLNGGYMRFGKMWSDSESNLQSFSFKMRVGGPYNNKISQLIDQDLVVAMILSLVLPQSAGSGSYTTPLMVQAFMRGVCNLDRAMITSLTITKGNGNLGYTKQGKATNLEISFTLTDMSELLVAPLGDSLYNNFNQETSLGRYISTLAGRDFRTNSFLVPKLKMALSTTLQSLDVKFSGASMGVHLADTIVGDIVALATPDISVATFNQSLK